MRSDFEPQLRNTPLESLWQAGRFLLWQVGRFLVPGMTRDELRSVIEEPASAKVVYFESLENRGYLVDQLIDEVAGMPGALPLLSFALSELYLKLARRYLAAQNLGETVERAITWSDYDELGGVTKSLTQRAEKIYSDLIKTDPAYDKTICYVMLRMVVIGGELARRQVPESEFNYPEPENSRVKMVIQEFLKARLLVSGTDAQNLPYIEPAHDALVRGWERLLSWKQNAEESLILQRRLTPAVEEWDRVQHQYQLSFFDKVSTVFNRVDYLFLPIENVIVRLINLPADTVKKIRQSSPSQRLLKENPQQFLWNSNPYLEVLKQTIQTQDNWLNQPERTFIQASVLQKRRNVSWRWRTAIAIILGLSGLTIAALIGQRNAQISQVRASRQAAEANFKANEQLNAFLDSLQAAQSLQSPLLTIFKPDRQLIEDVQGTLQKTIFTTQEKNRWLEDAGISRNAVSDDGKWIATATGSQVKLWNWQGQLQTQWNTNQDQIFNLSFSPNSQTLVTAGGNNTVRLSSLQGKLITEFLGHTDMVKGISFSPDGKILATSGKDMTVRLWTITGKPLTIMPGHTKDVWSVAFSPDGKTLVSASDDDTMRFWNLQGKPLKMIKAQQQELHTVQFSPNGQYLVTAGKDGTLGLWNQKGDRLASFAGHSGRVWRVTFSPDGQQLASSSADGTVRVWSIKGESLAVFFGHKGPVRTVNFSLNGQSLVSSGEDSSTRIWNLKSQESAAFKIPFKNPEAIAFSNDGKNLFAVQEKNLYHWHLTTQESKQITNNLVKPIKSLKINNDGQQLIALNSNDSLSFRTTKGQLIENKVIGNQGNQDFAYSSQQWLATGGKDGIVRLWDQQRKLQKEWRGHLGSVNHLAFSADGQQVVSAGQDSTIRVWNLNSNDAQIIFQLYDALPTFVTFSPDGKLIASGDNLGNIQLWNLQTKQSFATWKAYTNKAIQTLQFNPEATKLTVIAADGTIKVWALEDLDQLLNRGCQQLQDYLNSPSNTIVNPDLCETK